MEEELKKTKTQVEELSRKIESIERNQLRYPLDANTNRILTEHSNRFLPEQILDINWNSFFYFSSFFESIDRYYRGGTGLVADVTLDGLFLETDTVTDTYEFAELHTEGSDILNTDKPSRFKTAIKLDDVSESNTAIFASAGTMGFNIVNGVIYGFTSVNNVIATSIEIGTLLDDTTVVLELRYTPKDKVVFYVDGVMKGTIYTDLPLEGASYGSNQTIFSAIIVALSNAERILHVGYFEFMQNK